MSLQTFGLSGLSHSEFLSTTEFMLLNLANHPLAQEPAQPPFPDRPVLQENHDEFRGLFNAAKNGDRVQGALRNISRKKTQENFVKYGHLLVMRAGDSPDLLIGSGYENHGRTIRNAPANASMVAPSKVSVKHGELPGMLLLKCNRTQGAGSVDWQISEDEAAGEESWKPGGTCTHCARIEVRNLVPGKRYFFRVRNIGGQGPGPWSATVNLICM